MSRLLIALFALSGFALPAAAFSNGYLYSRAITVAGAVVPSTQVNFPLLVSGTYSYLATFPNQGMIHNTTTLNSQTVPADLIFTSDAAGTTLLNWEIASYTAATGTIEAWVRIPSLSNGTVIYMFYSNLSITTYQGSPTGAWDTFSKAIWHMANGVTQSLLDSTGNGNSLTAGGTTATSGKIDGGSANNGAQANGLIITSPTGLYNLAAFTYSMWINPTTLTNAAGSGALGLFTPGFQNASITASSGTLSVTVPTSGSYRSSISTNALATGTWQYVSFTYAGGAPRIYLNGVEVAYSYQSVGGGTDSVECCGFGIGVDGANIYQGNLNGSLDEVRIASTSRTSDWIATEYSNQNNPSTFYTVGSVTSLGSASGAASTIIIM